MELPGLLSPTYLPPEIPSTVLPSTGFTFAGSVIIPFSASSVTSTSWACSHGAVIKATPNDISCQMEYLFFMIKKF